MMEEDTEFTKVKTKVLNELMKMTAAIVSGDYTKRIVTDFAEENINRIANNLNQLTDELLLNSSDSTGKQKADITRFIDILSSYASHDFIHKLPITENGTILDAIATGINLLREELEQTTASKEELDCSFKIVSEQNKRLMNFSYIVSHNLRSHTNNIRSLLDLLENTDSKDEKQEIMQHLKTSSDLLNETIVNLNEIVSIQKNINILVEPLNLHDYIRDACEILSEQVALKKAKIHNNVSRSIIVHYNPAYLESIMLNFISNSLKYSDPKRIPVIAIDTFMENNKMILQIRDNGLGIDLHKHGEKLFGMYKTFHGNKDAKGIGLFISKNQIESMGGTIETESEPGVGSSFKIHFK